MSRQREMSRLLTELRTSLPPEKYRQLRATSQALTGSVGRLLRWLAVGVP